MSICCIKTPDNKKTGNDLEKLLKAVEELSDEYIN